MENSEIERIRLACTRFIAGHGQTTPRQALTELGAEAAADELSDFYGQGEIIRKFEQEIAARLGKEQAVFMPSGTMAQQIALRLWADRKHSPHVAFHPKCHLEIHEQKGYQMLHGLHGILVGAPDQLITLKDLEQVREPLAALLLELPQREIGGRLPAWEDLQAQIDWAHAQGAAVHLDGARLWESGPFYQRPYDEIAGLFDTVYVSFYKGLGGLAGAALAGPADFITEARIWQRRYGGNLIRLYPYVLSARKGLRARLPRMPEYHQKALEVAEVLAGFPEIEITPNPPHTNMMHVYVHGDRERLNEAALEVSRETQTWLFYPLNPSALPAWHKFELSVGDATLHIPAQDFAGLFREVFRRASN